MQADRSIRRRWPSWTKRGLGVLAVLATVGIVVLTLISVRQEHSSVIVGEGELSDGISVYVDVVRILPAENHLMAELVFEPVGSYVQDQDEDYLAVPVRVMASGGTHAHDEEFPRGAILPQEDLTVELRGGSDAATEGYRMAVSHPGTEPNGTHVLTIEVRRGTATMMFVLFTVFLMWALTALAVAAVVIRINGGGPIELRLISLLGVLLFAFPAVRNSMPHAPPVGVLVDFAAYFWCEIALGLALAALLATYIRRGGVESDKSYIRRVVADGDGGG